jgi:hypothetical protein
MHFGEDLRDAKVEGKLIALARRWEKLSGVGLLFLFHTVLDLSGAKPSHDLL